MRVMVVGAKGMLGREVVKACDAAGCEYIAFDRREFDITNDAQLAAIKDLRLDAVINCAGIVKGREVPVSRYVAVNGLAPYHLAEACEECGAKLVHVSTDCVFSGNRDRWYTEADTPDPIDLYSQSKALGEVTTGRHLTVRTSFIGFGERGLLAWLLKQQGPVPGYYEVMWNGLTAPVLARLLVQLAGNEKATGLMHLGTAQGMSKAWLLSLCVEAFGLPCRVELERTEKMMRCLASNHPAKADIAIPTFEEMLEELVRLRQ